MNGPKLHVHLSACKLTLVKLLARNISLMC